MLLTCAVVPVFADYELALAGSFGNCGSYPDKPGGVPFPLKTLYYGSICFPWQPSCEGHAILSSADEPMGNLQGIRNFNASINDHPGSVVQGTFRGRCLDSPESHLMPCDCDIILGLNMSKPVSLSFSCFITDLQQRTSTCYFGYRPSVTQDEQQHGLWWAQHAGAEHNSSRHL